MVHRQHVADNWKCPRPWREAGWLPVLNIISHQDENYHEEQQASNVPVPDGREHRKYRIHLCPIRGLKPDSEQAAVVVVVDVLLDPVVLTL